MVEFVLADPQARVFEAGGTVWMVAGSEPALFERTVERETAKGRETREILQALSREAEEGTLPLSIPPAERRKGRPLQNACLHVRTLFQGPR